MAINLELPKLHDTVIASIEANPRIFGGETHDHADVTALVVAEFCGGVVLPAVAHIPGELEPRAHYHNIIQDGTPVDLLREEFPLGTNVFPLPKDTINREDVRAKALERFGAAVRYQALRQQVAAYAVGGLHEPTPRVRQWLKDKDKPLQP
jgi:hypothetical protein